MQKPRLSLTCVLLLAALCTTPTQAQTQRVRVVTASHLPQAIEKSTTYAASCGPVHYQLQVSPEQHTVILRRSDGPDVNLGATSVGARLLDDNVLVHVGFNCPQDAINIFLKGVKLRDLDMPTGFRDAISVRSNGDLGASSPEHARIDELAIPGVQVEPGPRPH